MNWPADYHMHTPLCRHASGEPAEYAAHALAIGLTEIGFSDHSPMRRDDFDNWRMRFDQLDEYVAKVRATRKDFAGLAIRLSLEIDYLPGQEDWIGELAARHPWDYLIGSVHYVSDSWAVDDPTKLSEWKDRNASEVWQVYLERLNMAVESGFFDIIGHADLPKKFGFPPQPACLPLFQRVLKSARENRVAVELNTAGLRKPCKEIYPSLGLLRMANTEGVAITFGSDAHAPAEVGQDFPAAIDWAKAAGYREYCVFEGRRLKVAKL